MTKPRGRPFMLLAILLGSWVVARAAIYKIVAGPIADMASAPTVTVAAISIPILELIEAGRVPFANTYYPVADTSRDAAAPFPHSKQSKSTAIANVPRLTSVLAARDIPAIWLLGPSLSTAPQSPATSLFSPEQEHAKSLALNLDSTLRPSPLSRHSIYAYSFWRSGQDGQAQTFGEQYGASQTALIGTYRLGEKANMVALLWRVSYVPSAPSQSELALGVRWRPLAAIPVTLTAERRTQADGKGRFSAYFAGSMDNVALPAGFKLASYGQLGLTESVLKPTKGQIFYDAQLKIDKEVTRSAIFDGAIGGGAWAGGQKDIARLDIGPTVRASINLGNSRLRIDADWRFRIKGNARPGDGPALTLSTNF
jgi:hypothetical protein